MNFVSPIELEIQWDIPGDYAVTLWLPCHKDYRLGAVNIFLRYNLGRYPETLHSVHTRCLAIHVSKVHLGCRHEVIITITHVVLIHVPGRVT